MGNVYVQIPDDNTTVLEFSDVMATLAANNGKGMTDADASTLFTTDAIKAPFSKKKPVRLANHFPDEDYWKADGLCGFNLDGAKANSFGELPSKYNGGDMNGWEYQPPRGGALEPFRINDFKGYYTIAQPLVNNFSVPSKVSRATNEAIAMITLPIENERSLSWDDFSNGADILKDFYFGVLIYAANNDYIRVTANARLSETELVEGMRNATAKFNPQALAVGTYTAYPFICSHKYTSDTDLDAGGHRIYTLPKVAPITITVFEESLNLSISIFGTYYVYQTFDSNGNLLKDGPDRVIVKARFTNNKGSVISLNTNYAELNIINLIGDNNYVNKSVTLGTIEVPSGTTEINICEFSNVDKTMRNNCKLILSLNNAQYVEETSYLLLDYSNAEIPKI